MDRQQLEMRLECAVGYRRRVRRRRRPNRARWWFEQMRRAVDEADDWQPEVVLEPPEMLS